MLVGVIQAPHIVGGMVHAAAPAWIAGADVPSADELPAIPLKIGGRWVAPYECRPQNIVHAARLAFALI